jgi:hypothetical protein
MVEGCTNPSFPPPPNKSKKKGGQGERHRWNGEIHIMKEPLQESTSYTKVWSNRRGDEIKPDKKHERNRRGSPMGREFVKGGGKKVQEISRGKRKRYCETTTKSVQSSVQFQLQDISLGKRKRRRRQRPPPPPTRRQRARRKSWKRQDEDSRPIMAKCWAVLSISVSNSKNRTNTV